MARSRSLLPLSIPLLLVALLGFAAADADPFEQFLNDECNLTAAALPAAGSLAGFMGPMLRANTSATSYAYYRVSKNKTSAQTMVLYPGVAASLSYWPPRILKVLSKKFDLVILDPPGQGYSERLDPEVPLSIEGMAADAAELFKVLGLKNPILWGESMGGMVALAVAANHPGAASRFIVVAGSAGSPESDPPGSEVVSLVLSGNTTLLDALALGYPLDTAQGARAACFYVYQSSGTVFHPVNLDTTLEQFTAIGEWYAGPGAVSKLPNVTAPVLLVGGLADVVIPPQNLRLVATLVPRVWLILYPKTGHEVVVMRRRSVLPIIYDFLRSA